MIPSILDLDGRLGQIGAIRQALRDQLRQRGRALGCGNDDGIGRHDSHAGQNGVGRSGSRNHALDDRFLLHDQSLRASEVEFACRNQRLRPRQLKRSKRSDLNLAFVIFVELLRRRQRLLLYLDVFVQAHQGRSKAG